MSISTKSPAQFTPSNAVLAWLWPGVLFLFLGGILIGGLDVVDRKDDRLWFLAQVLCGPVAIAADFANQRVLKPMPGNWVNRYEQGDPAVARRLRRKSLGHVNEMGTLYCALAGLMNLVVILDALQPQQRRLDRRYRSTEA
jgi:hypothetical protein